MSRQRVGKIAKARSKITTAASDAARMGNGPPVRPRSQERPDAFTPDVRNAWAQTYVVLARIMKNAAQTSKTAVA